MEKNLLNLRKRGITSGAKSVRGKETTPGADAEKKISQKCLYSPSLDKRSPCRVREWKLNRKAKRN